MQIVAGRDQDTAALLEHLLSLSPDRIGTLDDLLGRTEESVGEKLAKHFDHFTPNMHQEVSEVVLYLGDDPDLFTTYSVSKINRGEVRGFVAFQYLTQTQEGEVLYGERWEFRPDGVLGYVSTPGLLDEDHDLSGEQLLEPDFRTFPTFLII